MTEEAFGALYDLTARDLLAYLLRRTASPDDAADALAETFLIAWDKRARIPAAEGDARPWLFGIARNVARRGRRLTARSTQAVERLARELDNVQNPVGSGEDAVTVALARLSPIDREIIEMQAWDQLPPREIALVLGLSANVVRVRAHRARQTLREAVTPSGSRAILPQGTALDPGGK